MDPEKWKRQSDVINVALGVLLRTFQMNFSDIQVVVGYAKTKLFVIIKNKILEVG